MGEPPPIEECHGRCEEDVYDVAVIGAGCVGGCVARELSKYHLRCVILEKEDDVTQGATKGNSGIVHAGYDDKPGTVRARLCWKGNQMFSQLDEELHFGFMKNGSLVVAKGPDDEEMLKELKARGEKNGVQNLRILSRDEVLALEPKLHPDVTAALYSPDAGVVVPYEFAIALVDNAVANGVDIRLGCAVTGIAREARYFDISTMLSIPTSPIRRVAVAALFVAAGIAAWFFLGMLSLANTASWPVVVVAGLVGLVFITVWSFARPSIVRRPSCVRARYIVNCAGLGADKVAEMAGAGGFRILPRIGEYLLLDKTQGDLCKTVLFPCPGPMGKGVLVQPTIWGNLLLGPTARDLHASGKPPSEKEVLRTLITKCRELIPSFDVTCTIHSFSGLRAKSDRGDWIIEEGAPQFINVAGIDSPGLAGCPAIAQEVVGLLKKAGLRLEVNPAFNPTRRPYVDWPALKERTWKGFKIDHENPDQNIICRCEKVTESEVVGAIRRRLPGQVMSTQAVRRRTRAGMGHCQGEFCEKRVAKLIARETGVPVREVPRRYWPATSFLPRRWLTNADRDMLADMK